MNTKDIIGNAALQATNALLSSKGQSAMLIPTPTDKVSQEAIQAYTSNAGPDANAWNELDKICKKASLVEQALKDIEALGFKHSDCGYACATIAKLALGLIK